MKKGKCPNCGAPIDLDKQSCSYCDTKYVYKPSVAEEQVVVNDRPSQSLFSDSDKIGCLKSLLTLGLIFLFRSTSHRD